MTFLAQYHQLHNLSLHSPLTMFISHEPVGVQGKWRPWIQPNLFLISSLISKDIPRYFAHSKWPLHWNVCFSRAALIMSGYRITGWSWRTREFLNTYLFTCLIPATFISSSTCNDLHLLTHIKCSFLQCKSSHQAVHTGGDLWVKSSP